MGGLAQLDYHERVEYINLHFWLEMQCLLLSDGICPWDVHPRRPLLAPSAVGWCSGVPNVRDTSTEQAPPTQLLGQNITVGVWSVNKHRKTVCESLRGWCHRVGYSTSLTTSYQ